MRIQTGTISFVDSPSDKDLAADTEAVIANSPYRDSLMDSVAIPAGNPVPSRPGDPSPIKHVIYIVQENRTYDQVLGDIKKGNGDASLVLFGENTTPNHHKIANEFVLFDNFYVSSDVSADGHNWATAAIAPDYTIKLSPNSYAGPPQGRLRLRRPGNCQSAPRRLSLEQRSRSRSHAAQLWLLRRQSQDSRTQR